MEGSRVFHQDLLSPLDIGSEREERPHHVVCYSAGKGTKGLDMEVLRESEDLKLTYLFHGPICFSGRVS